ncbi:hypothetical protein MetMK1DRAFT_00013480 [Metallosphaera yellowstonensis MK1]|uniref:Uncharacterized protein n=1 Tax=Metallosphaera yellowstonensis MK1 TaxID=671065 RepID=H2C3M3_9CREN|nr:hypothetical protein MetMK1DRAFT_00013480 [Metallosphaera yellowstonensis MK1]
MIPFVLVQDINPYFKSITTFSIQQLWDFSLGIALKSRQNLMTAVNIYVQGATLFLLLRISSMSLVASSTSNLMDM